jgi:hypothetical protein
MIRPVRFRTRRWAHRHPRRSPASTVPVDQRKNFVLRYYHFIDKDIQFVQSDWRMLFRLRSRVKPVWFEGRIYPGKGIEVGLDEMFKPFSGNERMMGKAHAGIVELLQPVRDFDPVRPQWAP